MPPARLARRYEIWLWRLLLGATVGGLVVMSIGVWLLSGGAANPSHPANRIWHDRSMLWAGGTTLQSLEFDQTAFFVAPEPLPTYPFTVEAQAILAATANPLGAWGIWIETANGERLIVAINGAQYVTARQCPASFEGSLSACATLSEPTQQIQTDWKYFRHIHPRGNLTAIRLDYRPPRWSGGLTLWLNHEWMWDLPFVPSSRGKWGLWVGNEQKAPVQFQWREVSLWVD